MREIKYLYDNFEILYLNVTTVITYIVYFKTAQYNIQLEHYQMTISSLLGRKIPPLFCRFKYNITFQNAHTFVVYF